MTTGHPHNCTCINCRASRAAAAESNPPPGSPRFESSTQEAQVTPFASPNRRSRQAIAVLTALALLTLISIWSYYLEIQLIQTVINGDDITTSQANSNDTMQELVATGYPFLFTLAAITFLRWMHQTSRNLPALGISVQHTSPTMGIISWFIPIYNLLAPFLAMVEIWKGSHPNSVPGITDRRSQAPATRLLPLWWITWIVSGIIGPILIHTAFNQHTPEAIVTYNTLFIVADVLSLVSLALLIPIIVMITSNQERKYTLTGKTITPTHDATE